MMAHGRKHFRIGLLAALLSGGMLDGAVFEAPREGPVAFRRDLLPLDVEMMAGLSSELAVLAQCHGRATPAERRTIAQLLGLALALNPAAEDARDMLAKMKLNRKLRRADQVELARARTRVWDVLPWLESAEAGQQGNALAACLKDVIALADPGDPRSGALVKAGEKGAWGGWIADTAAFEDAPAAGEMQVPKDPEPVHPDTLVLIKLPAAAVSAPLWTIRKDTGEESLGTVVLTMAASAQPPTEGVQAVPPMTAILEGADPADAGPAKINQELSPALVARFGVLPESSQLRISLPQELSYGIRNKDAASGAVAALAGAALSGQKPDGIVVGRIMADRTFRKGPDFWVRLRAVAAGGGGRVVIPAEAAPLLPSFLALEEPEFFLKFEVLLASDFGELLGRTAEAPGGPLQEQLAKFRDIQAKGRGIAIGQFVTNRFVRQRLIDLAAEAPYFASPKLLALQASGERPTRLGKEVLAAELKHALAPLDWVPLQTVPAAIDTERLDKSLEKSRAAVDLLERYADTVDRELMAQAKEVTTTARTLSRAYRLNANRLDRDEVIATAFAAVGKAHEACATSLKAATGDPEE